MIDPARLTYPQALPRGIQRSVTNAIPPGRYPQHPWAAQLRSNPQLSRMLWRGMGGMGLQAAAQVAPQVIPGTRFDNMAQNGLQGASMGMMFGPQGALLGGLANAILGIV